MIENLIKCLSDEEFKLFLKGLPVDSRSRLLSLALRRSFKSTDKDFVFSKVFRQTRTSVNDHLLRNELSILKKKAEKFIVINNPVDAPANARYYSVYALAVWCVNKNLIYEAQIYLNQTLEIAVSENAWRGALLCTKLLGHTIQYSNDKVEEKTRKLTELANNHQYYLKQLVARESQLVNYINMAANKLISASLSSDIIESNVIKNKWEFDVSNTHEPLANYYHLKSQAFLHSGHKSIELMIKCLEQLDQPVDLLDHRQEKLISLASIALEYSIIGEFEKAGYYYLQIINSPFFSTFRSRNGILINYATTLIKLKEYYKAIEFIDQINLKQLEPVVLARINTMSILAYIYTNDFKKLNKILPLKIEINELPLKLYNKFLYVIYYLIQDNPLEAQRELHNLMVSRAGRDLLYAEMISVYYAYIYYLIDNCENNRKRLEEELENFGQKKESKIYNTILSLWIREKSSDVLKPHSHH